ncbi:MAG TPA: rod shape-determining protein MreD [Sedimentisphaerales bacterium]|nr:rod shape-determining protein MreD [Sedimentisphaerales bacterium]
MRWLRFAVFILIVTVLQASLLDIVAVTKLNIRPNLLLTLLVFFAIYCNTTDAIITSFAIGFVADISIASAMGSQTISFGLFGTALAYLHRVIAIRKMPYQSLAIFITGSLIGALAHLLALLKGQAAISNIYTVILGTALYSAIVGPFLFLPAAWWMRIKTHRFSRH